MKLVVNGEARELAAGSTVEWLLAELGADPARVAVMVNEEIVAAADRVGRALRDGDRVEVFAFAGGG